MRRSLIAVCLSLLVSLLAAGPAGAQPGSNAASDALPWGPPVPKVLQGATATYRQRALQHCVRARVEQGQSRADAADACLDELRLAITPGMPRRTASR